MGNLYKSRLGKEISKNLVTGEENCKEKTKAYLKYRYTKPKEDYMKNIKESTMKRIDFVR